jgi:hypothetical protein
VVQADINAAINLALRAIADPRLWDIHPRLRTERVGGRAQKRRGKRVSMNETAVGGGIPEDSVRLKAREKRKFGENGPELNSSAPAKGGAAEDTRNPNFFYDVAGIAAWDKARVTDPLTSNPVTLPSGKAFWGAVKAAQWQRCLAINEARLAAWGNKLDPMPE